MRLAYAACLMALMATPSPAATPPRMVIDSEVLLLRHGVRSPTHEPPLAAAIAPQNWPSWPVPPGNLTPHGARAIELLAAFDREKFAADGLLPAAGCPAGVVIYTDVDERTIATGQAFAAGFAPGCKLAVGHAPGPADPLFSPLDTPGPRFDASAAKAAMLSAAGGDAASFVRAHHDLLEMMQAVLDPGGQAFLNLPAKISVKQPHQLPKLSGPVAQGASAAEDFLLEYLDGKPLTEIGWGRVKPANIPVLLALHPLAYTITARPPYISDFTAAPLASRILSALTDGAKLTVLVGHDTNQAELAGKLGLHWSIGEYPADDPPPGGGLLFVLSHDRVSGEKYVTVSYQMQTMDQVRQLVPLTVENPPDLQPLQWPGCADATPPARCSLAIFTKLSK